MPQVGYTHQQIRDLFATALLNQTPAGASIDQERFVKLDESDTYPRIIIYILSTSMQNDMAEAYGAPFEGSRQVQVKLEYHADGNDTAALIAAVDAAQTMVQVLLNNKTFVKSFQAIPRVDTRTGTDDTTARFRAVGIAVFSLVTEIGFPFP